MRIRTLPAWAVVFLLQLGTGAAPAIEPAAGVEQAQAAVSDAEKNLQHAIDSDPTVMSTRVKSATAQAAVAAARDAGGAELEAAIKQYQVAKAEEIAAVKAAAPRERRELADRQKELAAARSAAQGAGVVAQDQAEHQRRIESLVLPPVRSGDVEVGLVRVRIGPVSYRSGSGGGAAKLSEPLLSMLIDVQNFGKQPVEYIGWNTNAIATDAAEKQYLPAGVVGGTVLGRIVQTTVAPGATVRDLIVLQRAPAGKELTITLPAFNVGGSGAIQFRVNGDKIDQSPDPLIDPKTPMTVTPAPAPPATPAPTSQGATAKSAGHSADGVDFPPITSPDAKHSHIAGLKRLVDVAEVLLHTPGELNVPIYNVQKSAAKLAPHMSHVVDVPGPRARGVARATRVEVDQIDPSCQWFAFGVGNADVAGFEVRDGVISRMVLYYLRTDSAQRMLLLSYGQAPRPNATPNGLAVECGPWTGRNADTTSGRDTTLKRPIWAVLPRESPATLEIDIAALRESENPPPPARQ